MRTADSDAPVPIRTHTTEVVSDVEAAERAVEHTSRLEQGTRLYDALVTAAHLFRAEGRAVPDRRRAVLAVTDDKESNSKSKAHTVITELLESNAVANAVVINTRASRQAAHYSIGAADSRRPSHYRRPAITSPQACLPLDGTDCRRDWRRDDKPARAGGLPAGDVRTHPLAILTWLLQDTETSGTVFHRLTVRLSPARQRDYTRALVRARTGYYAAR